jgi:hypothetical protein
MFVKNLSDGQNAESIVANLFRSVGFQVLHDKKKNIDWDMVLLVKNKRIPIEIKFDAYEQKSGNIAIEVYNPKSCSPSGVTATKALLWIHILIPHQILLTTVNRLRRYIDNHQPARIINCGGDDNATLYLYKTEDISTVFDRIDKMKKEELQNFIQEISEYV